MTVTVKETTLGRSIVARCDDGLVAVAVEDGDDWRIVAGSLPAIRVASFDDALTWIDRLDEQAAHDAAGDVVAIRGSDVRGLYDSIGVQMPKSVLPSVIRVWIDPLDQAAKFKVGNGTWSPPLGQIEETQR